MDNKKLPNILFILSDQHNAKVLGHKGHPDVKTPNLDKMAAQGVRFDNAISQNPICTPSRVSWLSGQYCHNHGYYALSGPNPEGLPSIFSHFRQFGYKTGAIGKMHCPEYWVEDDCDVFMEVETPCSIGGSPQYTAYLKEKGLLDKTDQTALQEFGDRGRQTCDARVSNLSYADSMEGWSIRQAKEFIGSAARDEQPFLLHVSFTKPHQCYTPSEPFWSMYEESELTLPPNADYDMQGKAPHLRSAAEKWRQGAWTLFEPKTFEAGRRRKLHGYLGNVSQVDHAVGELLTYIDEKQLSENTIVIYSSDHGDYACEHSIMEKSPGICADAITRIPMIWRWPERFKAGHRVQEIVETVDMATTLCKLTGIESIETGDGKDISHLLHGENNRVHKIGVTEFAWSKSVRKGKYRYVYYPLEMFAEEYPDGFGELYDLENDPWEMNNLYFDNEFSSIVNEMKSDLLEWIITTTRPVTSSFGVIPHNSRQQKKRYNRVTNLDGKISPDLVRSGLKNNKNYM